MPVHPQPNLSIALKLQQAQDLLTANKPEQAMALLQRLAPKVQAEPDVSALMSMAAMRMGKFDQAEFLMRRALAGPGVTAINYTSLALILASAQKKQEAWECLDKALALDPSYNEARLLQANLLLDQRRIADMLRVCEQAMQYAWHPQVCVSYASAIIGLGESERAVAFLRDAVRRFPDETYLAALLAMSLTATWDATPLEVAQAHRAYGTLINRIKPPFKAAYQPKKDPDKKLRVALLSPDLRRHSVAYFIEPLLEHFNRGTLEIVCYSTNRTFDDVSARLKSLASLWRDTSNKIELQLAQLLSEDRIDIAIDLAGHTDGNSLLAFALRIAPVQATYCGYPHTTGLTQMDWRLVDSHTDPDTPAANAHHTEKLLRLDPCFLCYRPPEDAPKGPSLREGLGWVASDTTTQTNGPDHANQRGDAPASIPPITFGSFNATRKHNAHTIALWSRILKQVPNSKLVLKGLDLADQDVKAQLLARFDAHAVREHVEILQPTTSIADHLALYANIDIALDPMPYQGTTTTCEALWMGVPVITMAGQMHAGRVGVSLLTNVGAPELIAKDPDDYINIAVNLANDPHRLNTYRATLRARMATSPLLDRPAFAKRMEHAFRTMWRHYCQQETRP